MWRVHSQGSERKTPTHRPRVVASYIAGPDDSVRVDGAGVGLEERGRGVERQIRCRAAAVRTILLALRVYVGVCVCVLRVRMRVCERACAKECGARQVASGAHGFVMGTHLVDRRKGKRRKNPRILVHEGLISQQTHATRVSIGQNGGCPFMYMKA